MYYFYFVFSNYLHTSFIWNAKNSRQTYSWNVLNGMYFLFKVGVCIPISIMTFIVVSNYNISDQFVDIKCAEDDHTLQTVNTEFGEQIRLGWASYVYNVNTSRTTWKHCHVYRVNRGCPTWTHARYSLVE